MPMPRFAPRIHVLLAGRAPIGVVIRRGPSKSVCTILWDRRRDTFQLGQWLKGRIYERRSDVSPDGKHLSYFAMNGKWKSEARGSWTAISRTPFLKALAIFPKGDCWNGGGLFTGNHLSYRTLLEHRSSLNCRRLLMTHMSTDLLARLPEVELETAADGLVIDL